MRIALVCPYNYFRPGGVQACIRALATELNARGHYVRVIIPQPKKVPDDIDEHIIMIGGSTEFQTPFATKADLSMSKSGDAIEDVLEREKFDVIHYHEPGIPLLSLQIIGKSTSANVGTMHATLPDSMVSKSFEKLMMPFAKFIEPRLHVVTAVSEVAKEAALTYGPDREIDIVPNGICIQDYLPKKKRVTSNKKSIVAIGRLEKRKGMKYLLDAYALLRQSYSGVTLTIAGDGGLRESLEARVEKYAIPDVTFLGFVTDKEKVRLMQQADIYCSPAIYGESFGIVLLEAMAAGAVIVAGNNPGYSGVLTGKGKLSLVNPKNIDDFAQRLELLLFDEDMRDLMLEWSREYVKQFDFPKIVDQYERMYKKAITIKKKKKS
jgi:phosphatidylinositol alpha-mannosyltransferase